MENYRQNYSTTVSRAGADVDAGLRSYMLSVYNMIAIGLVITGVAAFGIAMLATTNDYGSAAAQMKNGTLLTQFGVALYTTPLAYVVMFLPLIAIFGINYVLKSLNAGAARAAFFVFSAIMGLSISSIFIRYTQGSIVQTFFITAASFGALSLYGYMTKRDLRPFGAFLFIGLVGILIAAIVNLFMQSSALQFGISVIGVLVFAGFTAYDTQSIKEMYLDSDDTDTRGRKVAVGALNLYIDFINLFMFLLRFLGNRN